MAPGLSKSLLREIIAAAGLPVTNGLPIDELRQRAALAIIEGHEPAERLRRIIRTEGLQDDDCETYDALIRRAAQALNRPTSTSVERSRASSCNNAEKASLVSAAEKASLVDDEAALLEAPSVLPLVDATTIL